MLRVLAYIFGGLVIGACVLLLLIPFLLFLFFMKLFLGRAVGKAFVWNSQGGASFNTGSSEQYDKNTSSENLSDSVYDIKAEVVDTRKTENSKYLER